MIKLNDKLKRLIDTTVENEFSLETIAHLVAMDGDKKSALLIALYNDEIKYEESFFNKLLNTIK